MRDVCTGQPSNATYSLQYLSSSKYFPISEYLFDDTRLSINLDCERIFSTVLAATGFQGINMCSTSACTSRHVMFIATASKHAMRVFAMFAKHTCVLKTNYIQ